jgi:hypothetical protein
LAVYTTTTLGGQLNGCNLSHPRDVKFITLRDSAGNKIKRFQYKAIDMKR